jgi:hypothetical protein
MGEPSLHTEQSHHADHDRLDEVNPAAKYGTNIETNMILGEAALVVL